MQTINQEDEVLKDMKSDDFFKFVRAWSPVSEIEIHKMIVDLHNLLEMERQKARKEAIEESVPRGVWWHLNSLRSLWVRK